MWKWLVGALVFGAILVCVGGGIGGGWMYYSGWRADQAIAEVEAEAQARAAADAERAAVATTDREGQLQAGLAAAAGGDAETAVAAFSEVIEGEPEHVEARLGRGRAYALIERLDLAEEDLRAVTRVAPERREGWESLAWVLGRMGRDAEAVDAYDRLLALVGDDARVLRDRANARYRGGDVAGARADAARACVVGSADGCALEKRIVAATRR